ncbi:MAG: PQQ-dependent sugar dehydrogenase [Planctomycetes bacterium]|jgi:glucose/arabinose dehydrogenase|nr:PQQ-dependent sugar dehydrogenase [Planctomycetota bacterium]
MRRVLILVPLLISALSAPAEDERPVKIRLPEGFSVSVFSDEVPGARSMAWGAKGTLFVGTRGQGIVYAVRDADGDGVAEEVSPVLAGLDSPNGVAFREGALFVAEISRILRYDGIEGKLDDPPEPVVVRDDLPKDRHHGWKFIAFGPDGLLYVPVGAPGNIVLREDDERYASILRMKPDGTGQAVFARGVRNTVGFDWHPVTKELWFTDNGRDWMGDDLPPDELNRASKSGLHFGYPFWHGKAIADPEYGARMAKDAFVPPEVELGAHVAALGCRFYTGTMFPEAYRGQLFIAEHGSWNRTAPIGYRVMMARMAEGKPAACEPFAEGWLDGKQVHGRPVDIAVAPDGALLVSDDHSGTIWRIAWSAPK